jgi:hypothetical protein
MCRGPPHSPGEGSTPPWLFASGGAEHPPRADASSEAQPHLRKESNTMRRVCAIAALALSALFLMASAASAVVPGVYSPTADSFDSANAPGSSHLTSGTPSCTVNANLSINCSAYVLGGVGHTNATVALDASYSAIIDCNNKGENKNNPVESHTADFSASSTASVASTRNGQLRVPAQPVSPFSAPQVCPNPNWTPEIRDGSLVLNEFTYTLTFAGFSSPYITITASDP